MNYFDVLGLRMEWHHWFVQQHQDFFGGTLGINIHDPQYGVFLPDDIHNWLHNHVEDVNDSRFNNDWTTLVDDLKEQIKSGDISIDDAKKRVVDHLDEILSKPKYKWCYLHTRAMKIPDNLEHSEYSKMTPDQKKQFFEDLYDKLKLTNPDLEIKWVNGTIELVRKPLKVAAVAFVVNDFTTGFSYAEEIYNAPKPAAAIVGVIEVGSPFSGPSSSSCTWDMNQREVAEGNAGFGALFETFLNPTSPRWLPTQVIRGTYDSLTGKR